MQKITEPEDLIQGRTKGEGRRKMQRRCFDLHGLFSSNGCRIAAVVETGLRLSHPATPVYVSAIAGVFFGTRVVDMLHRGMCLC